MTPTPDPFFKRITVLNIFLGTLIGMWLMLVGLRLSEFFSFFFTFPGPPIQLFTPTLEGLVMPLQLILIGTIGILKWRTLDLNIQRRAFQRGLERTEERAPLLGLGLGGFCLAVACGDFIYPAGTLPAPVQWWVVIGLGAICVAIGLAADIRLLLRQSRNKREAAQQEQERQQYILQSQMQMPPRTGI